MFSEHSKDPKAETSHVTTPAVHPFGRAGLFDVDPPQTGVSQDPNVVVSGEVDALPEEV
jgi:hypothetical protein